jgi:hypothetical protein
MTDDEFWQLIDKARAGNKPKTPSASHKKLQRELSKMSVEDIVAFVRLYDARMAELNQWRIWAAGYLIEGGMGDDGFHYFCSWIVGKGREVFAIALSNPDLLGPYVTDSLGNEELEYAALYALEEKGIEDPGDALGSRSYSSPRGEPFKEDDLAKWFPALSAQFD